ncbi:hypothetical protein BX666DRAFT_1938605 [Dichotomocladium elegans]|nr:hypothetical protein BX666DRAFT_1938605 [Dichotomocladium elegans]
MDIGRTVICYVVDSTQLLIGLTVSDDIQSCLRFSAMIIVMCVHGKRFGSVASNVIY